MRKPRKKGGGSAPILEDRPPGWRDSWKAPKKRRIQLKQFAGMSREEKGRMLREIAERLYCEEGREDVALQAIQIDNKMQGHNAAEKHEVGGPSLLISMLNDMRKGGDEHDV